MKTIKKGKDRWGNTTYSGYKDGKFVMNFGKGGYKLAQRWKKKKSL